MAVRLEPFGRFNLIINAMRALYLFIVQTLLERPSPSIHAHATVSSRLRPCVGVGTLCTQPADSALNLETSFLSDLPDII